MFKVIVERPRIGSRTVEPHPILKIDTETDLPKLESMKNKKGRKRGHKQLNENLSPLYRFLEGKVGERWDDVWSELCEHLDDKSAVKKHVKDHAKTYFTKIIKMINGVPYEYQPRSARHEYDYERRKYTDKVIEEAKTHNDAWVPLYYYENNPYKDYYIDPETNIIRIAPQRPQKKDPPPTSYVSSDKKVRYEFFNEIWWLVKKKIRKVKGLKPVYGYHRTVELKDGQEISKIKYGVIRKDEIIIKESYEDWKELKGEHLNIFLWWLKTRRWDAKLPKGRAKYLRK